MPDADDLDARVAGEFSRFADASGEADRLAASARFLTAECLVGSFSRPVHLAIRDGRVIAAAAEPALMRSWRFAFRATPQAWAEYWQPLPRPGWHDLLALTKRGEASLEGDLHPFLSNLQFFKDLLALPRGRFPGAVG
jgi:hypothetical protein